MWLIEISKYAGKDNEYLEMSINDNIAKLVQLLDSRYVSTSMEFRPVDMAAKFQFLTLDIISEIAFGTAFGNLEADDDLSSYMKTRGVCSPWPPCSGPGLRSRRCSSRNLSGGSSLKIRTPLVWAN
jgi:hypothetical protein